MKNALSFVPTIRPNLRRLRIPFLSLTPFAHRYPSQTLLRLKIYQKLFFTHMHNWLSLYICRKNTYQSAVIRSISKCLAPKFASLFTASEPEVAKKHNCCRYLKSGAKTRLHCSCVSSCESQLATRSFLQCSGSSLPNCCHFRQVLAGNRWSLRDCHEMAASRRGRRMD